MTAKEELHLTFDQTLMQLKQDPKQGSIADELEVVLSYADRVTDNISNAMELD